jgi:MFS family permease
MQDAVSLTAIAGSCHVASPNDRNIPKDWIRIIGAVVLGNAMEFFDFTVYAAFAPFLARAFFPVKDTMTGLLLSISTFGIGFLVRPLGGILVGAYSDRYGRKSAMTLTIGLMALASGSIGLLPTYSQIGVTAPILLVLARLVQGFSVGGELAPSTIFLTEIAPKGRKYFFGSFQFASQGMAGVMSGAIGFALAVLLRKAALDEWGWRIPFLMGILIAPMGIYIRRRLRESLAEGVPRRSMSAIMSKVIRFEWQLIVLGVLAVSGLTVTQYFSLYATTYAAVVLHHSPKIAMIVNFTVGGVGMVFTLIGGWLSDRLNAIRLVVVLRLFIVLLIYPTLSLASSGSSPASFLGAIAGLTALHSLSVVAPALVILRAFPASVRGTGFSITTALGIALFGGSAQIIFTCIIAATGEKLSFLWYVAGMNVVTIASLLAIRQFDRTRRAVLAEKLQ